MLKQDLQRCMRLMTATLEANLRDGVRSQEMLTDAMMGTVKARYPGITEEEWETLLQTYRQHATETFDAERSRLSGEHRRLVEHAVREGLPPHYSLTLCATIKSAIGPPPVATLARSLLNSER
ncbi:hypothetical protein [Bradyrhizobium iriomotense]|uniref:Uncharacterized protein n=1 Tax=Bradyrhizobium iriomotense TaxID=441950 RepID=A0ABQ6AWP7_9BRAD|nr:hypothetical protein [Bradyrhizobium iriomotense]GLR85845.1 hypothetical protein GCM10007857_25560 [Bradyrhizobium iriomotense]